MFSIEHKSQLVFIFTSYSEIFLFKKDLLSVNNFKTPLKILEVYLLWCPNVPALIMHGNLKCTKNALEQSNFDYTLPRAGKGNIGHSY